MSFSKTRTYESYVTAVQFYPSITDLGEMIHLGSRIQMNIDICIHVINAGENNTQIQETPLTLTEPPKKLLGQTMFLFAPLESKELSVWMPTLHQNSQFSWSAAPWRDGRICPQVCSNNDPISYCSPSLFGGGGRFRMGQDFDTKHATSLFIHLFCVSKSFFSRWLFSNLDSLEVVGKHIPQMVVEWWFTMVESKQSP